MTNAEKYLTVSTKEFKNAIINTQGDIGGLYSLEKWLDTEVKPTLTEDERVILKNIDEHYRYISREKGGYIRISFADESFRKSAGCDSGLLFVYNHLFQFIKERRRIFY